MPKGSPGKSQAELRQMDMREERLFKRLKYYEERVYAVELGAGKTKGEQHKVIYNCMREGVSYRAIGLHLGISRETVRKMKDEFIIHLCLGCHFERLLNLKKSVASNGKQVGADRLIIRVRNNLSPNGERHERLQLK